MCLIKEYDYFSERRGYPYVKRIPSCKSGAAEGGQDWSDHLKRTSI